MTHMERIDAADVALAKKADGTWVLEVLGAPYGGPVDGKDAQGEYFSPRTDFMLEVGEERPVVYFHGTGQEVPEVVGKAKASRRDERGLWFDVTLNKVSKFAARIWEAALKGIARASSGAVGHLVRKAADGEILVWAIGELSLFDTVGGRRPANELASVNLKAAFDLVKLEMPEAFVEADEVKTDAVQEDETSLEDHGPAIAAVATVIMEAANKLT